MDDSRHYGASVIKALLIMPSEAAAPSRLCLRPAGPLNAPTMARRWQCTPHDASRLETEARVPPVPTGRDPTRSHGARCESGVASALPTLIPALRVAP